MPRRFRHWAYLNDEGVKEWGDVFPDQEVPVVSMIWTKGTLGEPGTVEDFFLIQWDELTPDQQKAILEKLALRFKVPEEVIKTDVEARGLPLRMSLTKGSGTNHPGLFV